MTLRLQADIPTLTIAIDGFSARYHEDYFRVRERALAYLSVPPSLAHASALAEPLLEALTSWGAGRRSAPRCSTVEAVAQELCDPTLHERLHRLANSFSHLALVVGERRVADGAPFATVDDFDRTLIETLHMLARALLVGNTNVTYPMKALLLITGLMPAYDSQVKGGLALAGLTGVNRTRYLLPRRGSIDAMKICALPFHVADCVARSRAALDEAVGHSRYPSLANEYGRLFDVLLFVQCTRPPDGAFIRFVSTASTRHWYAL